MTLGSSGTISLANLQTEFGGTNPLDLSEYYAYRYTRPTYIGATAVTSNGTTNMSLALHGSAVSTDTVYLLIVYENSTATRPTITGFTSDLSFNGTAENVAHTAVFMRGTVSATGTTITIPNDATYGGGGAIAIIVRNSAGYTVSPVFDMTTNGVFTKTILTGCKDGELGIYASVIDGGAETMSAWSLDADFTSTYTYLSGNGAATGRAAAMGALNVTSNKYITLTQATAYASGGCRWVYFTVRGAAISNGVTGWDTTINKKISSGYTSIPANGVISLDNFYNTTAVGISYITGFDANALGINTGGSTSVDLTASSTIKDRWLLTVDYIWNATSYSLWSTTINGSNTFSDKIVNSGKYAIRLDYKKISDGATSATVAWAQAPWGTDAYGVPLYYGEPTSHYIRCILLSGLPTIGTAAFQSDTVAPLTVTLPGENNRTMAVIASLTTETVANNLITAVSNTAELTSRPTQLAVWANSSMASNTTFTATYLGSGTNVFYGLTIPY